MWIGFFKFMVKFWVSKDVLWFWIKDIDGSEDGEVVFFVIYILSINLLSYLDDISRDIVVILR